jgi:hypothetical protein
VLPVVTGTSSITITATASAGVITLENEYDSSTQTLTSGVASGAIALGAAGSIDHLTITVKETNKIARVYVITVSRAAT